MCYERSARFAYAEDLLFFIFRCFSPEKRRAAFPEGRCKQHDCIP